MKNNLQSSKTLLLTSVRMQVKEEIIKILPKPIDKNR